MRHESADLAALAFDVGDIDVRFHQRFQRRVLITRGKHQNGTVIEQVADAAGRAQLALGLGKAVTDIAEGAVGVVGQALDDDHAAAGAETLVTGHREVLATAAPGLVDGLLDHVGRHLVLARALQQAAQGQVGVRVGAARFAGDVDFPGVSAINPGLGVRGFGDGFLAVLVGAAHEYFPMAIQPGIIGPTPRGLTSHRSVCRR